MIHQRHGILHVKLLTRFPFVRFAIAIGALCLTVLPELNGQTKHQRPPDIDVRVSDFATEMALDKAKVDLLRLSAVVQTGFSDASGTVRFPFVDPETYTIRAARDGYQEEEMTVEVTPGQHSISVSVQMRPLTAEGNQGGMVSARKLSLPPAAIKEVERGTRLLDKKTDLKKSVEHFQKAVSIFPDYYEAYFLMGVAFSQMSSSGEAETALRKALELNSKFLPPYQPLALLLFSQKRFVDERLLLEQAAELDPQSWKWPYEMARCLAKMGDWDRAVEYGKSAGQKPRAPTKIHILMGDLYSNSGSSERALAEFEEFAKLDPNSPFMPKVREAISMLQKHVSGPTPTVRQQ